MSERDSGGPSEEELARIDEEFRALMPELAVQVRRDALQEIRRTIIAHLTAMRKSTRDGFVLAQGHAYMASHGQEDVTTWPHSAGRRLYTELRLLVRLYCAELAIAARPGEKLPEFHVIENAVFDGMMESRTEYTVPDGRPHMLAEGADAD